MTKIIKWFQKNKDIISATYWLLLATIFNINLIEEVITNDPIEIFNNYYQTLYIGLMSMVTIYIVYRTIKEIKKVIKNWSKKE